MISAKTKEIMDIFSSIAQFPPECSDCVAFCAEGRISVPCNGDWFKGCENRSDYIKEAESEE